MKMPCGLHGAVATFQPLMDKVLHPVTDRVKAYIYDIVVFSTSWEDHLVHLRHMLQWCQGAGLIATPKKCRIEWTRLRYLGSSCGWESGSGSARQRTSPRLCPGSPRQEGPPAGLRPDQLLQMLHTALCILSHFLNSLAEKRTTQVLRWSPEAEKAFYNLRTALETKPVESR